MDDIERWKFEVRQAMLDYAIAEKRGDPAAIDETSTRACKLVDELAAKIAAERERCAKLCIELAALSWAAADAATHSAEKAKHESVAAAMEALAGDLRA